jgi:hypothetical protein
MSGVAKRGLNRFQRPRRIRKAIKPSEMPPMRLRANHQVTRYLPTARAAKLTFLQNYVENTHQNPVRSGLTNFEVAFAPKCAIEFFASPTERLI